MEYLSLVLFLVLIFVLIAGYPVVFSLAGTGLFFAFLGILMGQFDFSFLEAIPNRIYTIMTNELLIAVPLFIFMGAVLERSGMAENLLNNMALLFGSLRGGMAISVTIFGMLMAASTGIVGATVVTMGLLALPTMLKRGYSPRIAAGTICASGTLGQVIPPSIVLVLLGDVISSAYQRSQLEQGNFSPDAVSVGDLFLGALIPGLMLVACYLVYLSFSAWLRPHTMPPIPQEERERLTAGGNLRFVFNLLAALLPPVFLIILVLGSILAGFATPTEAAAVGGMGALFLAVIRGKFKLPLLREALYTAAFQTSMVFMVLIGASIFSLVFRGFGGDDLVRELLTGLPGGAVGAFWVVMLMMFLLGFFIDFIEITFVVVPIVGPVLMSLGMDPIWLGVMMAMNLQTSFLTPPFGFSLFYLRGVAPAELATRDIYMGVIPFIVIQLLVLGVLFFFNDIVTWLPQLVYG